MQAQEKEQDNEINQLLAKAEQQWNEGRLTRPFGDNAYDSYRQVLRLDPDNSIAKAGVAKIVAYYEQQAQQQKQEDRTLLVQVPIQQAASGQPPVDEVVAEPADSTGSSKWKMIFGVGILLIGIGAGIYVLWSWQFETKATQTLPVPSSKSQVQSQDLESIPQEPTVRSAEVAEGSQPMPKLIDQRPLSSTSSAQVEQPSVREPALPESPAGEADPPTEQTLTPEQALPASTAPEEHPGTPSDEVTRLLDRAQQQWEAGYLTEPAGDNALNSYRTVLAVDSKNEAALAGLDRLREHFYQQAQVFLQKGELQESLKQLAEGLKVRPGDIELLTLQETVQKQLSERQQQEQRRLREVTEQINLLLEQAENDLSLRRLTVPEGSNAYEKYLQVLAIDPDNARAHEGLRRIVEAYIDLIDGAIRQRDYAKAESYLERAELVLPSHEKLQQTRERVDSLRP